MYRMQLKQLAHIHELKVRKNDSSISFIGERLFFLMLYILSSSCMPIAISENDLSQYWLGVNEGEIYPNPRSMRFNKKHYLLYPFSWVVKSIDNHTFFPAMSLCEKQSTQVNNLTAISHQRILVMHTFFKTS